MPEVDIIVPAYNAQKYLADAIESVGAQTFQDWRILLVDDGSTDDTAGIAASYIERLGPKLKYIHQENRGLPAARNTAIRNSSAEFLALLDADDIWLPNRLEESLKSFARMPEAGLSYGFIARIDPSGKVIDTFERRSRHAEGMIAPYIYMRKIDLPCPTITFRRKCVDEVGGFDESLRATEDRDLWVRIALRYPVTLAPALIAHYRTSMDSMSGDPERMLTAQRIFIEKHYGSPGCGWAARRVALGQIYRQRAEAFAIRKRLADALASALKGLRLCPWEMQNVRTAGSLLLEYSGIRKKQS
ncbi:MAG TPA: glycosyltransferase family A protein [Acidobacteriaceae bacterium]|nr:glycosyltransferase family A protein [Acidobacteriaceae bacterium]